MIEIKGNQAPVLSREVARREVRRRIADATLGELWTQLEAELPPSMEFYVSRQPDAFVSKRYAAETYDTVLVNKRESAIGYGRTPEAAIAELLVAMWAQERNRG